MLSAVLLTMLLSNSPQEKMIPEGTILPIILNETISTKKLQDNDPILFSLADDVREGGHRGPILIPRGSAHACLRSVSLDSLGLAEQKISTSLTQLSPPVCRPSVNRG